MSQSGILYDTAWNRTSGAVWLDLEFSSGPGRPDPGKRKIRGIRAVFKAGANFLLLAGAAGALLTFLPVAAMEIQYGYTSYKTSTSSNKTDKAAPRPAAAPTAPLQPRDALEAFSIDIPKIDAHSVVIPNVDAGAPAVYLPALKQGVAHALGTGLPDVDSQINRTIYLFAHSTSAPSLVATYNAQFYLLNKMEAGDEINITFWAQHYRYRVVETRVVEADDTSWLAPQIEKEQLILATCTPPGTTWKRLLVIADRVPRLPEDHP